MYQKFNKTIDDTGAHYTATKIAAFVIPDLKELLVYAEAVRKNTFLEYLKGLKPKDFDKLKTLYHKPVLQLSEGEAPFLHGLLTPLSD